MSKRLNILKDEFTQDVHTHFAWMRANEPVYRGKFMFGVDAYLITRYDDVVAALKDPRIIKNAQNATTKKGRRGDAWMPKFMLALQNNMLNMDDPDHRRLRNLIHKAFTPRMIQQMESKIERIAHDLLDQTAVNREMEFIEAFALPLPVTVIAEMVGIPEADRPKFFSWAEKFLASFNLFGIVQMMPAVYSLTRYIRKLADERRADPRDDLMTALVEAEDAGDSFTEEELVAMIVLLVIAGYETTVSLIANGTYALLQNPAQFELLKSDHSLLGTAIEEFLRYDSPIVTTELSYAREDIVLHGVTIPQGKPILPALASANRDEAIFENADMLDITRQPNKHVAFGLGVHYCLGAPLARLEAKVAFCVLLERMPDLRLNIETSAVRYRSAPIVHRIERLPVAW